jgi:tetratricopeptide (TPR) repeat protein
MNEHMDVKAWNEKIVIPTYEIGKAEKYPVFLEKRVYQGSSGSVYPFPVVEKIYDEKKDKEWEVVYLENDYVKIMILPALGGRVQMAWDKIKQRHFVYYNHVIKPALVGLTGPWISGGIEFNWPQHHRPSTYLPTDYDIQDNEDGSKTVWVNEVEKMYRTKGMAGFTLYPGRAYMEIKVHLYNRTSQPKTFMWWANPAVQVNDHYQSVFPPDVNAVFDHGKRDVSKFPIATGTYYKVDYSAGVDISRYKNLPVPTSYMAAVKSKYDFVGGYEHDAKGGLLHVADHHVSPGKKQWTWGNGDFGHAWDRNLTDSDGPYIELMCGVYTDNQPDFSWLHPYEEKSFRQYFMPYRDLGLVKNATTDAMVNLEFLDGKARVRVYTTAEFPKSRIRLYAEGKDFLEDEVDLSPESSYDMEVSVDQNIDAHLYMVEVRDEQSNILVSWQPEKEELQPVTEPAKPARDPREICTNEQLYLTGLHLEQYHHATYDPTVYYLEALKRDSGDVRNNNAMGSWLLLRGKFQEAEKHFQKAVEVLTKRNPNPYYGEPLYNLGVARKMQNSLSEAYEAFYKATWNAAWADAGYFSAAQIKCSQGNFHKAFDLVNFSLKFNQGNHKARHLKVILLRKLNQLNKTKDFIQESLILDRFNYGVRYEKYLIEGINEDLANLKTLMRDHVDNYLEYSLDYAQAGLYQEAIDVLNLYVQDQQEVYPMVYYFMGWYAVQLGKAGDAKDYFRKASEMPHDYCFAFRMEEMIALRVALNHHPNDYMAHYYLGNYWYAARQYEDAAFHWEQSRALNDKFPITRRNLALIYYNKKSRHDEALQEMEKAFELDNSDSRVLMELDQLYKKMNKPVEERLSLLENNSDLVESRDDLYLERIALYNMQDRHEDALHMIMSRNFHPWEGGEGKVPAQYIISHEELAKRNILASDFQSAVDHLEQAQVYPHNLGEGKLYGTQENDIHYWLGCAWDGLENSDKARHYWKLASTGISEPSSGMEYNDKQPDQIFYQGLALLKLGEFDKARSRFNKLFDYGEKHIFDQMKIDYFAVSLPDMLIWNEDLNVRYQLHCRYLMGLSYLGFNRPAQALEQFNIVLKNDPYHYGTVMHKKMTENKSIIEIIKTSKFQRGSNHY